MSAIRTGIASPLVTIITPTFNRANFLVETIESVLSQDYPCIEYIVLDDGSTDNTVDILRKYDGQILWESHRNMGETRTVNKGFAMAKGDIICVVNSDDPLLPGAVSEAVSALIQYPEALVAYPDWLDIDEVSRPITEIRLPNYTIDNMLLPFAVSMGPGTFFRKSAIDLAGPRDTSFTYAGDLDFWFRLAVRGPFVHIPKLLATHRTHSESASSLGNGAKRSGELIRVISKACHDPLLPERLVRQRRKIFSNAHSVAYYYCGTNNRAALKHRVMAFCYTPIENIGRVVRTAIPTVNRIVVRTILRSAGFVLPKFRGSLSAVLHVYGHMYQFLKTGSAKRSPDGIRFGLVSHVLPPSWSGQAVMIGRLLQGMDPRRYCLLSCGVYNEESVEEFIPKLPGPYYQLPRQKEQWLHGRGYRRKWISLITGTFSRGWAIACILSRERCSALIGTTGNIMDLPAAYLASRVLGIPFYPYLFDDYVYQWQDPVFRTFAASSAWFIFPNSKGIIVPNEFLQQEIHRRYKLSSSVLHNPSVKDPPETGVSCNRPAKQEIRIVYTGAIYHVNFEAFHNLVVAIQRLALPGLKLHIYTANAKEYLEQEGICGDRIEYHGHVAPSEVENVHREADILFMPFSFNCSVPEVVKTSAPGKLSDYLVSGRPILAHVPSDCFVSWYLKKYQCGLVVDKNDPDELAQAIRMLLLKDGLTTTLVHNATTRAAVDFAPSQVRYRFRELIGCL